MCWVSTLQSSCLSLCGWYLGRDTLRVCKDPVSPRTFTTNSSTHQWTSCAAITALFALWWCSICLLAFIRSNWNSSVRKSYPFCRCIFRGHLLFSTSRIWRSCLALGAQCRPRGAAPAARVPSQQAAPFLSTSTAFWPHEMFQLLLYAPSPRPEPTLLQGALVPSTGDWYSETEGRMLGWSLLPGIIASRASERAEPGNLCLVHWPTSVPVYTVRTVTLIPIWPRRFILTCLFLTVISSSHREKPVRFICLSVQSQRVHKVLVSEWPAHSFLCS